GVPAATPRPSGVPDARLAALVRLERDTATAHARDALLASPPLAALLAQLAASEASHPVALS
ncbi:MAG: hypothetical protein JWN17_184, partial [Frankiales bacterium]|nr:hypothetical protein [Frankiales bacterium]